MPRRLSSQPTILHHSSAAASCAQMQSSSSVLHCTVRALLSAQLLCLLPPEARPVMEEPKTYHPVGLPSTNERSEPVGKHSPLRAQWTIARLILHTSSEIPDRIKPNRPLHGLAAALTGLKTASRLFPQRIGLLNDQLNFQNLPNLTIYQNFVYLFITFKVICVGWNSVNTFWRFCKALGN